MPSSPACSSGESFGHARSSFSSVATTMRATATLMNPLWSAGITYQGANARDVAASASS